MHAPSIHTPAAPAPLTQAVDPVVPPELLERPDEPVAVPPVVEVPAVPVVEVPAVVAAEVELAPAVVEEVVLLGDEELHAANATQTASRAERMGRTSQSTDSGATDCWNARGSRSVEPLCVHSFALSAYDAACSAPPCMCLSPC
jgi:hypothetical protein